MLGDQRALSTTVPNAESTEAFTPGTAIGRFLVLTKIGSGGMHGSWPFAGETPAELAAAITAGRLAPPARRTPEWLRSALTRGLAADAEARWP